MEQESRRQAPADVDRFAGLEGRQLRGTCATASSPLSSAHENLEAIAEEYGAGHHVPAKDRAP